MIRAFFITATDTDAGKTVASCALLNAWRRAGHRVAGLKPIAAGATQTPDGWRNEDALALMQAAQSNLPYDAINPVCLPAPIAPHIAIKQAGLQIDIDALAGRIRHTLGHCEAERVVIEGAGGWRVPLNDREDLSELARLLKVPVILVVPLKLGCLSMARLTVEAIRADGCQLAGWIGNRIRPDTMAEEAANLDTLKRKIPAPYLGLLPYVPEPETRRTTHPDALNLSRL